jgi:hypothetical protein
MKTFFKKFTDESIALVKKHYAKNQGKITEYIKSNEDELIGKAVSAVAVIIVIVIVIATVTAILNMIVRLIDENPTTFMVIGFIIAAVAALIIALIRLGMVAPPINNNFFCKMLPNQRLAAIINYALTGLEAHFGLPKNAGKGLINIISDMDKGVLIHRLMYAVLPSMPEISYQTSIQLIQLLDTAVKRAAANMVFEDGFLPPEIYISRIFPTGNTLVIEVIQIVSQASYEYTNNLKLELKKEQTAGHMSYERSCHVETEMYDDEI